MSIYTFAEQEGDELIQDFDGLWDKKIKPFIRKDVEPTLKTFFQQFTTSFGAQALTAALGGVAALSTGAAFGTVATGLATTLIADAKADAASDAALDATQVLQTIQSALQVAKVANGIVTPADQTAAAAIAALPTPAPAPDSAPKAA